MLGIMKLYYYHRLLYLSQQPFKFSKSVFHLYLRDGEIDYTGQITSSCLHG